MATVYWTGAGDGTTFSLATNWSPNTTPGNNGNVYAFNTSATVVLTSSANVASLTITNGATVSFSGAYTLSATTALEIDAGSTIKLASNTTLSSDLTMSGTGTATISGGTVTNSGTLTLASGQNLLLTSTSLTDNSPIGGSGTVTLGGSATLTFTGSGPSATIVFSGTGNLLSIPQWTSGLTLQNFTYGDTISEGGQTLYLIDTGKTNSSGQTLYELSNASSGGSNLGTVTLAAGTTGWNNTSTSNTIALTSTSSGYTYPCFCAGTRLAAEDGEIEVQDVVPGTRLRLADGRVAEVRWLGVSRVSTVFADPLRAFPIRIAAGALGDNLPVRDLLVSPDHAMFLDGILVQASALVGCPGITREHDVPEAFNYYHVELEAHELLLAEGAPTESFVDNIDRMNFHNWDERSAPVEPIIEMDYPRAKSARQLPAGLRARLNGRGREFRAA